MIRAIRAIVLFFALAVGGFLGAWFGPTGYVLAFIVGIPAGMVVAMLNERKDRT